MAQGLVGALATNAADLPFALLYPHEVGAPRAQLQAWYGLPAGAPTLLATAQTIRWASSKANSQPTGVG